MEKIVAYTDGACKKNPGPGGWGNYYFFESDPEVKYATFGGCRATTNNQMELTALRELLRCLPEKVKCKIYIDSQYLLKIFVDMRTPKKIFSGWVKNWKKNNWRNASGDIKNKELIQDIYFEFEEKLKHSRFELLWVKGHSGNEGNDIADALANLGVPK